MVPIWIGALLFLSGILFMAAQPELRGRLSGGRLIQRNQAIPGAQEPFAGVRHESELARVCARRARHRSHARGSGLLTPPGCFADRGRSTAATHSGLWPIFWSRRRHPKA